MRVFIVSDLEGVSGIVKLGQVVGGKPLYDESGRLYTEEINAAVRGAKAAGATEIVVMDCHGAGNDGRSTLSFPTCSTRPANTSCRTGGRSTRNFSSRVSTQRSSSGCTPERARDEAS